MPLVTLVKHHRRIACPSLGGATPLKPGGGYVGDGDRKVMPKVGHVSSPWGSVGL